MKESHGERVWFNKYPSNVSKHLDYPDYTLSDLLRKAAERCGDRPAIFFLGASVTYNHLWEMVLRMVKSLSDLGLVKGDVCALMLPNSIYEGLPEPS